MTYDSDAQAKNAGHLGNPLGAPRGIYDPAYINAARSIGRDPASGLHINNAPYYNSDKDIERNFSPATSGDKVVALVCCIGLPGSALLSATSENHPITVLLAGLFLTGVSAIALRASIDSDAVEKNNTNEIPSSPNPSVAKQEIHKQRLFEGLQVFRRHLWDRLTLTQYLTNSSQGYSDFNDLAHKLLPYSKSQTSIDGSSVEQLVEQLKTYSEDGTIKLYIDKNTEDENRVFLSHLEQAVSGFTAYKYELDTLAKNQRRESLKGMASSAFSIVVNVASDIVLPLALASAVAVSFYQGNASQTIVTGGSNKPTTEKPTIAAPQPAIKNDLCTSAQSGLNIRQWPTTNRGKIHATVPFQTAVTVTGAAKNDHWLPVEVDYGGQTITGYAHGHYIKPCLPR